MNMGIFGGSFDPPHIAHSTIAETIGLQFALDQVLWVPAYAPPHKPKHKLTLYEHRLNMVRAAIAGHSAFRVSGIEKTLDSPTYTVRMLDALQRTHPRAAFHLILGSDSLARFDTWAQPEVIARNVRLLVYPRADSPVSGADLPEYLRGRVQFAEAPVISLRGEQIRRRFTEGKSVQDLILEPVLRYICKHHLYQGYNGD